MASVSELGSAARAAIYDLEHLGVATRTLHTRAEGTVAVLTMISEDSANGHLDDGRRKAMAATEALQDAIDYAMSAITDLNAYLRSIGLT